MIWNLTKIFILILVIALRCTENVVGQNEPAIIYIRDLPQDGFVLDSAWRFHIGDSPEYASPGFDDSSWEIIDPTLDIHTSLPQIPEGEICWMRLRISIDSAVNDLVMQIQQSVASEIYMNGRLIRRLGVVDDTTGDNIKADSPQDRLFPFPIRRGEQLLSVRFAKQPGVSYGTHWSSSNPAVKIRLNSVEGAVSYFNKTYKSISDHDYFLAGVFSILGVLYLALYVLYPAQKANLFFSIYAFLQTVVWSSFNYYHQLNEVEAYTFFKNLNLIALITSHLSLLLAIYSSLKVRRGWLFLSVVAFAIVCIPVGILIYDAGWKIYGRIFTNAFNIVVTWVAFNTFRRSNKRIAIIILVGGICFTGLWAAFTLQLSPDIGRYFFVVAHLSMPLAVSLYLGYDFALTNRSLQQKLLEVSTLSEEKQLILTSQNETLDKQVTERTAALKQSVEELKSTQAQLIQSEKMASLGELTAGIAHEIQNPLNFVNNFSELNAELIDDLKNQLPIDNKSANEIADAIKENQEKINHHGKRADAIVKSMLQHSRTSSGQKELTDINALCDEYLRLTYHGYRAKDKTFSVKLITDFDSRIPKISAVPHDIGRVVLNLLNNAMYAVGEKAKQRNDGYEPTITITTRKLSGMAEIRIHDNGIGIADSVKQKIFQPFFTTKPTGQGTGLGLSLAYDIITKAHGGEIKVEGTEGQGSEFVIKLQLG